MIDNRTEILEFVTQLELKDGTTFEWEIDNFGCVNELLVLKSDEIIVPKRNTLRAYFKAHITNDASRSLHSFRYDLIVPKIEEFKTSARIKTNLNLYTDSKRIISSIASNEIVMDAKGLQSKGGIISVFNASVSQKIESCKTMALFSCKFVYLDTSCTTIRTVKINRLRSLIDYLNSLLDCTELSDIQFKAKETTEDIAANTIKKTFQAHKAILAARSRLFERLLSPDTYDMETNIAKSNYGTYKDAKHFEKILQYIYTTRADISHYAAANELLPFAKLYELEELESKCLNVKETWFLTTKNSKTHLRENSTSLKWRMRYLSLLKAKETIQFALPVFHIPSITGFMAHYDVTVTLLDSCYYFKFDFNLHEFNGTRLPIRLSTRVHVETDSGRVVETQVNQSYPGRKDFSHNYIENGERAPTDISFVISNRQISPNHDPFEFLLFVFDFCCIEDLNSAERIDRDKVTRFLTDMESLRLKPNHGDVIIKMTNTTFLTHRIMLAQSPVLRAMLVDIKEENQIRILNLSDTEPEIFQRILDFMYTGQLTITSDEAMKFSEAAKTYKLQHLYEIIKQFF